MDGPRQHALSRAAFSPDEHRRIRRRDLAALVQNGLDLGVAAFERRLRDFDG